MNTRSQTVSSPVSVATGDKYLLFLAVVLAGYAIFDKGFALILPPPVFIGELALLIGVIVALATPRWSRVFEVRCIYAPLALAAWGVCRTIPFISHYQIDAIRDAAVYYYSGFGIVLAVLLLADPTRLGMMLGWFGRFWRAFLILVPLAVIVFRFFRPQLPVIPWSENLSIIYIKEGDVMVILAAVLAFWVAGFETDVKWGWFLLMAFCIVTVGVVDRAGMLAYFAVGALCLVIKPRHRAAWRLISLAILAVLMLWLSDVHIEIPGGKGREVSFRQIVVNVGSLVGHDSGDRGMDSNKDWRLNWWSDVVDYTFHGPYLWTGKGFGVNLADDDGYQLFSNRSLRSPHSAHFTFLARGGLPGLVLWLLVPLTWGYSIVRAYIRSRKRQEKEWEAVFSFVGAFGAALIINASFDVYLEGPMGGVWFWCVYGFGIAALWIYQNCPQTLIGAEPAEEADNIPDRPLVSSGHVMASR